jgi:uncharacterized repeat protein (TIGR01451 family)
VGTIENSVTVASVEFDEDQSDNAATESTVVDPRADLWITKTDGPDPADPGATLTYTLDVVNEGPNDADSVIVTDSLPPEVTYVGASGSGWSCDHSAGTVTCTRTSLSPGAAPSITIDVTTPSAGGSVVNHASVDSSTDDPSPADNSASAETTVLPPCPDDDGDDYAVCDASCAPVGEDECGDCDDTDDGIHPGVVEMDPLCEDDRDNDCDGLTDGEDPSCAGVCPDLDSDGYAVCDEFCTLDSGDQCGDCDDDHADSFPGADEICDGRDNDCDTVVPADESNDDGDDFRICDGDCDDGNDTIFPDAPEYCNGEDDDCDGTTDEPDAVDATTWYADADSDGFGDPETSQRSCIQPPGFVGDDTDCDDTDETINPGADEICDGKDNDCDDVLPPEEVDGDVDGFPLCNDCDDTDETINPGADEICDDEIDNDCDDLIDLADLEGCGLEVTLCSILGDHAPTDEVDEDVFVFTGIAEELITLTLEPRNDDEGRANLILTDAMEETTEETTDPFFEIDRSDLPNEILEVTLPRSGEYRIGISEQARVAFLTGERFSGEYCLTMESAMGSALSLAPTDSVEDAGDAAIDDPGRRMRQNMTMRPAPRRGPRVESRRP